MNYSRFVHKKLDLNPILNELSLNELGSIKEQVELELLVSCLRFVHKKFDLGPNLNKSSLNELSSIKEQVELKFHNI